MASQMKRERGDRRGDAENGTGAAPKRRRPLRWLVALAVLAAIVWLLPGIVAHTPLLGWIIKMASADLGGSVTVQSASLGWFSPVAVRGVEVKDAKGKPVLTLAAASGDRTLAAILCNSSNLGGFCLESPKLTLVLRDDGSNVEDMLAKYLAPKEQKPPSQVGFSLKIVDGGVSLTDQRSGLSWQVQKLAVDVDMRDGVGGPLKASVSADLPDARYAGKLAASVEMAGTSGKVELSAANLPLASLRAVVARFSPGTTLTGRLSLNVGGSWGGKNSAHADLGLEAFSLATPALQSDVVQLDRLSAGCQVSWQTDRVEIEKASVDCDLGGLSLASTVRLGGKDGFSLDSLAHQQHELSGRVDLARLARLLPATLRLRQQVEINSGQVQVAISSRSEQQGMKWHGQVDAANITATAAGRQIAWEQPISLAVDVHETSGALAVDALRCESDFLKIHAAGTPDALAASLSFNLKQLADRLGQFVDLGAMQLAGEGWGNVNWKRSPQQQFDADAEIHARNFQLALPNQPAWREEEMVAQFSAKGQTDFSPQTRIDAATLSVKAGSDQLDAGLAQPVGDLKGGGVWPVRVRAQGQLQNWPGRLAAWLPMKDWQLTGGYALEADATASQQSIELRQLKLAVTPLIVASSWLSVNEPRLDVAVAGSWNQKQGRLQIEPASLNCATAGVQANNIVLAMPEKGPLEVAGTVQYQGDAARIGQWFSNPAKPAAWRLAGQLKGEAHVQQTAGVIHGETTAAVAGLAVIDSSGQQFQEPSVRLAARGDYNRDSGVLQLEQCELSCDALTANATGRVAPVSGENNAQLSAELRYDLERLCGLLRPCLGPNVRMAGRGSSTVSYRGPFSLAGGSAAANLRWDAANAYGLQVGPGELKAAMANGVVQIEPLDLAVSQGRMHLAPRVRLTPDPMELTLPAGPLAQRIQIDPALCASLLKYGVPILADVATAQGAFSIDLDGCRIPLREPGKGELAGRLTIHSAEFGAGPLTRELAVFLGRETPAKLRQESVVRFRMVDGRVYHENLELIFPNITIRTCGSVGLDQTLSIMAETQVPPQWLEKAPLASRALGNQIITVPITGTLSKPQLDKKVMEGITRQFLQKAAENVLEGGLNRLFGPKK